MAFIRGDGADNTLLGSSEADEIHAEHGDDIVRGRGNSDFLTGGTGQDKLFGGTGDDWLKDGFGVDILVGGDGRDTFEFVRLEQIGGREKDIVRDFEDGLDTLWLGAVANAFDDLRIRDTKAGHVKIIAGDRVIVLKDKDGTLDAADLTEDDFSFF